MSNGEDDHRSPVRNLKQQWKNEDAARDELERQRKKSFLEQQANEVFAPVDNYLARVHKVLHAFGASVEVASVWEHLDDQKLRRTAKVISSDPTQRLLLAFVVQGTTIFYRDRSYQLSHDIEALMRLIAREVEQFVKPR